MTPEELVEAIKHLLELNNYDVWGPVEIHGAEVDLVAKLRGNPFTPLLYIEATVEYVNNDKYGKDVGKLAMIGELEPDAQRLIVSSEGFSLPVKERAEKTRIRTLTYDELFRQFERFDAYVRKVLFDGPLATELRSLDAIYEEPLLRDPRGEDSATKFLDGWRLEKGPTGRWLIIVGEYGTGKTALTRVLQYRWTRAYYEDPRLPIPFRIELRHFTRQFDARGLLHHFLDTNGLGHVSLDFVRQLIRDGRIVLLLDGYDEMAQHLDSRARRACLEALAELAEGGAKGLLTSRPNYFTETEELLVFEVLYSSIEPRRYYLGEADRELLEQERRVDRLLEQFLVPYERRLQDLTPEQTELLVGRVLAHDSVGRDVVLGLLRRVFRDAGGDSRALAGKPVIVTFLLDLVEELKEQTTSGRGPAPLLTEWQVYKLIIDKLMLRDLRRSPDINPESRRRFLHQLSVELSRRAVPIADETLFKDLVAKSFERELRRAGSDRNNLLNRLSDELRSSTTLTRQPESRQGGYGFSHNSLREYLLAEFMLDGLTSDRPANERVVVTDAMRLFVASQEPAAVQTLIEKLAQRWSGRQTEAGIGATLTLLWDAAAKLHGREPDPSRAALAAIAGNPPALNGLELERVAFSSREHPADLCSANFSQAGLIAVDFRAANLHQADFSGAILDAVILSEARLTEASFREASLWETHLDGADVTGADFSNIVEDGLTLLIESDDNSPKRRVEGKAAVAYLNYRGATTSPVAPSLICMYHPNYPIVEKIVEKLAEQATRQRRGIEQRGAARANTGFARAFVALLEKLGLVSASGGHADLLSATAQGREVFQRFVQTRDLPDSVTDFIFSS